MRIRIGISCQYWIRIADPYDQVLFMVWLLLIYMERCKCLFMGIPGVSSFYPIPLKTVKSQKNGVKNGVRFWDVCQIIKGYNFAGFQKMQLIFRYRNVIL